MTGAVCGRYSALWDDWVEFGDDFRDDYLVSSSDIDSAENIRGALGATSVSLVLRSGTCLNSRLTIRIV